ncbi:cation:proton antiporter subunit C [Hyphococcus flavus]|uniref:Cation:proton antiporter subunit C n=1 Tax=Hyphococcus flavus TaxID=1866326 RepID=A0AAF0CF73_9PROT|nr:cation:proton antiporter subunit C [Hyphococcus flavus]WDI32231.1 cation:proton antiporter subunit C [Hyphococcus flavus]
MEPWVEFILERYNYWIVIVLMMTGLYIVYARGNLVKKIVGLNLFQTSVFIFYITIGKIAGGTAPIYIGGELDHAAEGHGEGHGGDGHSGEEAGHGEQGLHGAPEEGGHEAAQTVSDSGAEESVALHSKIQNDLPANDLKEALRNVEPGEAAALEPGLHSAPADGASKISNEILSEADKIPPHGADAGFQVGDSLHGADAANAVADHSSLGEVIYSNPLPHVLILTAIVVGVATTAVGLALAVRIREAYGTIEEDELETMDNVAEFGDVAEARAS